MAATPEQWDKAELLRHLQAAVELELLVIPPYLSALYSLEEGTNREAELIIRSVVVEEMLHMTLAANVLNAVGGEPRVNNPAWTPRYPTQLPFMGESLVVDLKPFSIEALDTFLAIENPAYPVVEPVEDPDGVAVPRVLTLGADEEEPYSSVGAFYGAIEEGLKSLVKREGESAVFTGSSAKQVGIEYYYAAGGAVLEVTDLDSALAAIDLIVEQGEGDLTQPPSGDKFDPSDDLAHFYRFNELRQGQRYRAEDEPREPTGEAVEIDFDAVYPMKPNLRLEEIPPGELHDAAEECCRVWSRLLDQIQAGFTGEPAVLRDAVVTMFELKYAAQRLLRVPLPDGSGVHAGPTFEYQSTPTREDET